jgi:hypothetical protein
MCKLDTHFPPKNNCVMGKGLWFVFLLVMSPGMRSQGPEYLWTKAIHGSGNENVYTMHTDPHGYVYIAGQIAGTADLDPGPALLAVTPSPSQQIGYVCKFDPLGSLVWAKWLDGPGAQIFSLCTDNVGNIYVCGNFMGQVDFDPSGATYTLTSAMAGSVYSSFVWKLSGAGQFLGAGEFGGGNLTGVQMPLIRFDGHNNLYCIGGFAGSADLDPGPGVTTVSFTGSNVNAYILKLDLALNLSWVGLFGNPNYCRISDLEVDQLGNPWIDLRISSSGTVDIDPGSSVFPISCNGTLNALVIKIDPSGNLVSAIHAARNINQGGVSPMHTLALDKFNEVVVSITTSGSVVINPGPGAFTLAAGLPGKIYLLHYDQAGIFLNYDTLHAGPSLFIFHDDTLVFCGTFASPVDFDPSPSSVTVSTAGGNDAYVYALDKSFQLQWLKTFGGPGNEFARSVTFSNSSELYVAGGFSDTCDFDPAQTSSTIAAQAASDVFLSKFSPCPGIPYNASPYALCAGSSASLVAISPTTISWYQGSTGGTALTTGSLYATPVLSVGTHTYYVSASSCSLMPRTPVIVVAEPVPSLSVTAPSGSICLGNSVTLTAAGAMSYQWNGGPSGATYVIAPTQNTFYTVTGSHTLNSCVSVLSATVLVSGCLGLEDQSENGCRLYPNPATSQLTIKNAAGSIVTFLDLTGRTVLAEAIIHERQVIQLDELHRGVWLVEITGGPISRIYKLIKE